MAPSWKCVISNTFLMDEPWSIQWAVVDSRFCAAASVMATILRMLSTSGIANLTVIALKVGFGWKTLLQLFHWSSVTELKTLHDAVLEHAIGWFNAMSTPIREGILAHYGPIPEVENAYWDLPNGPAWTWWIIAILPLDPHGQVCLESVEYNNLFMYYKCLLSTFRFKSYLRRL